VFRPLLVTLTALTLVHGLYRILSARPDGSRAVLVSELERGDTVDDLSLQLVGDESRSSTPMLAAACQILVVFDPACPHCLKAAEREAQRDPPLGIRTLWVGEQHSGANAFRPRVHRRSEVGWLGSIKQAMEVRAVPAAFLLDSVGVVLRVWPYYGTEDGESLRNTCGRGVSDDLSR